MAEVDASRVEHVSNCSIGKVYGVGWVKTSQKLDEIFKCASFSNKCQIPPHGYDPKDIKGAQKQCLLQLQQATTASKYSKQLQQATAANKYSKQPQQATTSSSYTKYELRTIYGTTIWADLLTTAHSKYP